MKTVLTAFIALSVGFYAGRSTTKKAIDVNDEINLYQLRAKTMEVKRLKDSLNYCRLNYDAVAELYFENDSIK